MVIGIGADLLGAVYQARNAQRSLSTLAAQPSGASAQQSGNARQRSEALPPWDPRGELRAADDIRRTVLANGVFFDPEFSEFSRLDASEDEKALFAAYQGLRRLQVLAVAAGEDTTRAFELRQIQSRFEEGVEQLGAFFEDLELEGVTLLRGEQLSRAETDLAISRGGSTFETGTLLDGAFDSAVPAFQGDARFTITVRKNGADTPFDIDLQALDDAGLPRTLDNVAQLINDQFEAAGVITRVERYEVGEPDENGVIPGDRFGLRFEGILTERLSFSAPDAKPAFFIAGSTGPDGEAVGQLTKVVNLDGGGDALFSRRFAADPALSETENARGETVSREVEQPLDVADVLRASDGGVYVLGRTGSAVDGRAIKGESDLVLRRYDTSGRPVWTRTLGAGENASGLSLAEAPNGDIVAVGSISGGLSGTIGLGASDSILVRFDSAGREQLVRRFGGLEDDQADAVAVGADGVVFVGGRTQSSFSGVGGGGGTDAYVRAYGSDGELLFTREVAGGAEDQRVAGLALAADGGLLVATVESGRAVLTKYAPGDDGTGAPVFRTDLGDLEGGSIGGLAVDETGAIFLAGAAGAGFAPAPVTTANAGGRDAFVLRLSAGGAAEALSFTGSNADDRATDVAVSGGQVFIAGRTNGALPGETLTGERNAFGAVFDAASLALASTVQVSGRGGFSAGAAVAVDPSGDSVLDRFGLPTGELVFSDSRIVTDRSSARAGDFFYVSVDGGRKRKITLEDDDTYRTLTFKLNAAFVLDAAATVRRTAEGERLRIEPKPGVTVEFFAGEDGRDALAALGLVEGAVTGEARFGEETPETADAPEVFAVELAGELSLATLEARESALERLTSAISTIQAAYRELTLDPALRDLARGENGPGRRGGTPPAFLTAQIANYQAGLNRLLAGGGGVGGLF